MFYGTTWVYVPCSTKGSVKKLNLFGTADDLKLKLMGIIHPVRDR